MQKIISAKPSLIITGLPNGPVCVVGPPATGVFEPCDRFSAKARYPFSTDSLFTRPKNYIKKQLSLKEHPIFRNATTGFAK